MENRQSRTFRHLTPRKAFLIAFDAASTVITALLALLLIYEREYTSALLEPI